MAQSNLELWDPLKNAVITQRVAENANESYARDGLIGHTSLDMVTFWGDIVRCAQRGLVYSVLNKDNPDLNKYRAVCMLVDGWNGYTNLSEVVYGHLHTISVSPGQFVNTGQELGTEGNTGEVYSGGKLVSVEAKMLGNRSGTHLHGPQVRPVEKILKSEAAFDGTQRYLINQNGVYCDTDGYVYRAVLAKNGLNGCINPEPFMNHRYALDVPVSLLLIESLKKLLELLKVAKR